MKFFVFLLCLLGISSPAFAQERTVLQDEAAQSAWREDVDFLVERLLAVHPDPFYRFPESEFVRVASQLKADLPFLSENQIIAELARIAAMLDGHTYLFMLQPRARFQLYPVRLYVFEEGVYVVNAAPQHRALIGQRLVSVNGIPAQSVLDLLAPYSSTDNLYYLRLWMSALMVMPELLQAVGIIDALDQPNFAFMNAGGELVSVSFSPITVNEYAAWNPGSMFAFIGLPQQETMAYLTHNAENFWHTMINESQTLYIQYNHVYSATMSGMTIHELAEVVENAAAAGTAACLVIDLRNNGGGDNTTYRSLLRSLRESAFNHPERLFVIIGRMTFSAGKDFALDVARDTSATFVGEPTGGMPNNYGDSRMIRLPNSGLEIGVATSYVPKGREDDVAPWLAPDVVVPVTAADYFAGRDAALEAVLAYDACGK